MRLRESSRAARVALVGSGWENDRSWVAHVYIIPAERILSFQVRRLWLSLKRSLSLRLTLTHTPSPNLILRLNLNSSLSPRLGLSLIMIVKETERAEEKKEKQKKKQKQIIKRRNERKTLNSTAPKSRRKCLGDVSCCLFVGGLCSKIVRYRKASVPK